MKLFIRFAIFAVLTGAIWVGAANVGARGPACDTASAAVAQVNGGDAERRRVERGERDKNFADVGAAALTVFAALGCFAGARPRPTTRYYDRRTRDETAGEGKSI